MKLLRVTSVIACLLIASITIERHLSVSSAQGRTGVRGAAGGGRLGPPCEPRPTWPRDSRRQSSDVARRDSSPRRRTLSDEQPHGRGAERARCAVGPAQRGRAPDVAIRTALDSTLCSRPGAHLLLFRAGSATIARLLSDSLFSVPGRLTRRVARAGNGGTRAIRGAAWRPLLLRPDGYIGFRRAVLMRRSSSPCLCTLHPAAVHSSYAGSARWLWFERALLASYDYARQACPAGTTRRRAEQRRRGGLTAPHDTGKLKAREAWTGCSTTALRELDRSSASVPRLRLAEQQITVTARHRVCRMRSFSTCSAVLHLSAECERGVRREDLQVMIWRCATGRRSSPQRLGARTLQ